MVFQLVMERPHESYPRWYGGADCNYGPCKEGSHAARSQLPAPNSLLLMSQPKYTHTQHTHTHSTAARPEQIPHKIPAPDEPTQIHPHTTLTHSHTPRSQIRRPRSQLLMSQPKSTHTTTRAHSPTPRSEIRDPISDIQDSGSQ